MAYTKAQLEALAAQLLASQQPIAASQHRSQVQTLIDELFSAQSRGNVLAAVQSTASTVANDTALIFRNGAAFRIPLSALAAVNLSDLGDVFISNPQNLESLVYNEVNDRWENLNISSAFVPYTGALQAVNLGFNSLTASTLIVGGTSSSQGSYLGLKQFTNVITGALGFTSISATSTNLVNFNFGQTSDFKSFSFDVTNITGINARVYLMPNANGTIALTSDITTALAAYQLLSQKGQANGYAQLDGNAKLPISIIPDSIIGQVEYMGTWNAATNTPTLPTTPAEKGHYYVTSVAGTFVGISFEVGDWIISNGTAWEKVDNTDAVTMVFGRIGSITAQRPDYASFYVDLDASQNVSGNKTFLNTIFANAGIRLDQNGTALPTFIQNINGNGLSSFGSNGLGFNNANNLYFSGSNKQGGVFVFNNAGVRNYTLQDANGTLAFTSDITTALGDYVTLGTAQTITGIKTFNTGSLILAAAGTANSTHLRNSAGDSTNVSGSNALGFNSANNIYVSTVGKGGFILSFNNGAANRVYTLQDASGTLAFTSNIPANIITGTGIINRVAKFTGVNTIAESNINDTTTEVNILNRLAITVSSNQFLLTPGLGGTANRIETVGGLPLQLVTSGPSLTLAAGGATPQFTLTSAGAVTLTGALNGSSAVFSGTILTPFIAVASTAGNIGNINSSNANGGYITWQTSGTTIADIGTAQQIFGAGGSDTFGINARGLRSLILGTNDTARLTIASTGAATFSSSVQATKLSLGSNAINSYRLNIVANSNFDTAGILLTDSNTGGRVYGIGSSIVTIGNLDFVDNTAGQRRLTINSEGAATFFNSVSARNLEAYRVDGGIGLDVNGGDLGLGSFIARFKDFSNNPRVVITGNGNLGIGTTVPTRRLTVTSQSSGDNALFTNATDADLIINLSSGITRIAPSTGNLQLGTNLTSHVFITGSGRTGVGFNPTNTRFGVYSEVNESHISVLGNSTDQGGSQNYKIVRHYPQAGNSNKLIIPFISQGSLNSNTIVRIVGHSARFNTAQPLGFVAEFAVGHLQNLSSLQVLMISGNALSITTSGMNVEINFTFGYGGSPTGGIFATIEYMTNFTGYSIIVPNITLG